MLTLGPEELQVLPHLLWFEFGVEDGQFCEHAHVSALQPQRRLQHGDQLLEIATVLMEEPQISITDLITHFMESRPWTVPPSVFCLLLNTGKMQSKIF